MRKQTLLVWKAKPFCDNAEQRSLRLPPSLHAVFPSDTCSQTPGVVSTVWPVSAVARGVTHTQSCCSHTCLGTRAGCLMADIRKPAVSSVSLFLRSEGRGCQQSEESRGRAGAGGDQRAISPSAPHNTDFTLHASLWNITPPHPALQLDRLQPQGSSTAIIILLSGVPAYLVRSGRYGADWFLAG